VTRFDPVRKPAEGYKEPRREYENAVADPEPTDLPVEPRPSCHGEDRLDGEQHQPADVDDDVEVDRAGLVERSIEQRPEIAGRESNRNDHPHPQAEREVEASVE
jgi:hypothetical protein